MENTLVVPWKNRNKIKNVPAAIWKMAKITAIEMARKAKINPRLFCEVLRDENFDWHKHKDRWTVEMGSEQHRAMQRVLRLISN